MELIKKHIVTIVLCALTAIGSFTWSLIQKGSEATINEKIDARIEAKISDNQLIETLLNTEKVKEFTDNAGREIKKKIIEDVIRKDTNKISMRAFIGSEIGVRDEKVLPLLSRLLKDYNDGKITTTKKTDSLIKRHLRINRF